MARIRTIKPDFFTSLTIAELTPEQRLTFIGLWTHVDDEGRCVDDARLVKGAIWPLDDRTSADVEDDLDALDRAGLIVRYVVSEDSVNHHGGFKRHPLMAVTSWVEHQVVNRPSKSKLPPPESGEKQSLTSENGSLSETHGLFSEDSLPEQGTGNREQGTGKDTATGVAGEFDRFWQAYPRKVGKADARKKFTREAKTHGAEHLIAEAERWAGLWHQAGTEQQFIPHPATWLNGQRWDDEPPPTQLRAVHQPWRSPDPNEYYEDIQ